MVRVDIWSMKCAMLSTKMQAQLGPLWEPTFSMMKKLKEKLLREKVSSTRQRNLSSPSTGVCGQSGRMRKWTMRFLQETGCGGKIARGDEIIKWPGVHLWDHRQWVGMGRCHSLAIWIVPFWALEHLIPTPQMSTRPSSPGLYPTSGQLPSTASNLIVPYPCTDCFYLLSKIHKQDCPGRSIVSACSCPTELAFYSTPLSKTSDLHLRHRAHPSTLQ